MFGKKKNNYFYESFENLCLFAIKEIDVLKEGLENFSNDTLVDLKNNVHKIEHEADKKKKAMLFVDRSKEAVEAVYEVLKNFDKINNKEVMDPLINKVLTIEEAVDKIYEYNVHKLYIENKDYDYIRLGERVYSYFEYVTDKCRDICKTILIIMYKNL